MLTIDKIFAVIDPTNAKQRTLERAAGLARIVDAKIHAYVSIYSTMETTDQEALQQAETHRYEMWMETIVEPVRAQGLEVETEVAWNKDWRSAIAPAAEAAGSDLIIKSSRARSASERLFMKSSDLALFKTARCPVYLIKADEVDQTHKVLIAIDARRDEKKYKNIRDNIIEYGRNISSIYDDGDLHAVHSYTDQSAYVHVTDMEKLTGLDTDHVHVVGADPEQAIAKIAEEINAQIIIIGLSTKSTLRNRVFGSTGEWLLNNLNYDLLVIFPDG